MAHWLTSLLYVDVCVCPVGVTEAPRDSYEYQAARKTAFSRWLAGATAQTTRNDLLQSKVTRHDG